MRYISWTWFLYVVIGFLLGGGAVYLWSYLKEKAVKLVWYEWFYSSCQALHLCSWGKRSLHPFRKENLRLPGCQ